MATQNDTIPFSVKLNRRVRELNSRICVGLDPDLALFPKQLLRKHSLENVSALDLDAINRESVIACIIEFNLLVIDAVQDLAAAVKPQSAHYERFGSKGIYALEQTVAYARSKGLITILDAKRNDIGSTANKYAMAYIGRPGDCALPCDALTVNAYLGADGILPFVKACEANGKGIFILVKTSNPSSVELQDLLLHDGRPLCAQVAEAVERWGRESVHDGYSAVGAVVGATWPKEIKTFRALMPHTIFLMPGYGAQGATAADLATAFDKDGFGAIINSARGITYNYDPASINFQEKIRENALLMKEDINTRLKMRSPSDLPGITS